MAVPGASTSTPSSSGNNFCRRLCRASRAQRCLQFVMEPASEDDGTDSFPKASSQRSPLIPSNMNGQVLVGSGSSTVNQSVNRRHHQTRATVHEVAQNSKETKMKEKMTEPITGDGQRGCICRGKKNECIKLCYECFAAQSCCGKHCSCQSCGNRPDNEEVIQEQLSTSFDSLAFAPKRTLNVLSDHQDFTPESHSEPPFCSYAAWHPRWNSINPDEGNNFCRRLCRASRAQRCLQFVMEPASDDDGTDSFPKASSQRSPLIPSNMNGQVLVGSGSSTVNQSVNRRHHQTRATIHEVAQNSKETKMKEKMTEPITGDGQRGCICRGKKNECIKLCCERFAAQSYYGEHCSCQSCCNRPENEEVIQELRTLSFAPKDHQNYCPPQCQFSDSLQDTCPPQPQFSDSLEVNAGGSGGCENPHGEGRASLGEDTIMVDAENCHVHPHISAPRKRGFSECYVDNNQPSPKRVKLAEGEKIEELMLQRLANMSKLMKKRNRCKRMKIRG